MAQKVTITFSLDAEDDKDLLAWLGRQENRSAVIRDALRARLTGGVTLGDIYQAVKDLDRKLDRKLKAVAGTVQDAPADDDWNEPPDVAAVLDALGKL